MVLTTLVQCGWWLVVRIYRELPIVGNALPIHPYDIFQCNFFKELWEAVFCVNKEGFVDESLQVSRKRGFWR